MSPESLQLKKEFEIQKIASLHYFEYKSDFIFKSEYHDYWKLLYVEDGSAEITFSNKKLSPVILEKGDLFIQSPDEYYSFKAAPGKIAVLYDVIAGPGMRFNKTELQICQLCRLGENF